MTIQQPGGLNSFEAIAGRELFRLFGRQVGERILQLGQRRSLAAGEILFREGDPGDSAFVLLQGSLEVFVELGRDRVCVAILEPFKLVGEIAVFADQPRIATVTARSDSVVLCLQRQSWLDLLASDPAAGQTIIADLGRRLAAINRPLAFLSSATQLLRRDHVDGAALAVMAEEVGNLGPFAESFSSMVREIQAKQERRQDMAMARRIQQSVMPTPLSLADSQLALHGLLRPMKEVGGDLYDYFMVDAATVAIAIADVSGKGVPAALFMMMFHTVLRAATSGGCGPDQVLVRANDLLSEHNDECMFVTAFFGLLDLASGRLTYVNAGHNPPYLLRANGDCQELPSHGVAIGMMAGAKYRPQQVQLGRQDLLFLYTDGITEAMASDHGQYGEARLLQALSELRGMPVEDLVEAVVADVDRFADGFEQSDDITCLAVQFHRAAEI